MSRILIGLLSLAVLTGLGVGLVATYKKQQRLEAPTALAATPLGPTSVELRWKPSENAESYNVVVGSDRTLSQPVVTKVPAERTRVSLSDLKAASPGVDQFYRVDAIKDDLVRSSRTTRFTLKPGAVRQLKVRTATASGFKATWRKVANARQFDITIARDKGFTRQATTVRTVDADPRFVTKGLKPATTYWFKVRPVNSDQIGTFTRPVKFVTNVRETSFRVGTWNVCSEKCSDYASRARIMADYINANKIDMFGLQESGGQRVGKVTNAIFSGHSQKYVRADGGARARYIFYRPALFTQQAGGNFSIGDGRDTTWARFKVNKTGRVFYFVSVHLENGKGNDAKRAREMDRMLGQMALINDSGKPMIYAGDFNSGVHRGADSPGIKMRAAGFGNTFTIAKDTVNGQINTSHTFSTNVLASTAHVDHIWVSKQFDVESWAQLVRLAGGRYATPVVSDHNLLSAVVALDATQKPLGDLTPTTSLGAPAPQVAAPTPQRTP
ncbi:fibronectin type III domain-containing protein [Aeromicrobium sp. UC242_57]|uniref:fibronectin type III domain-containing protein n=1 Tax=Aeromicrobium sp. UC242_57 TaxID=3374624 RepID=UPI0037972D12